MFRKNISEQSLGADRWISFDPLDNEIIERLFKKDIREGEEKLMLAVLASAIQHFQKYVLSKDEKGRTLQGRRGSRKKLVKTRVAHTSLRFSRTA